MSGEFLKGYRALDLTGLSGQLCGRMLADLGMEVIKIEPPGGDPVRNLAPFVKSADGKSLSTTFAHLNAGKASKVVDLDNEAGTRRVSPIGRNRGRGDRKFSAGRIGRQRTRLQRSRGDQSGHRHGIDHRVSAKPDRRKTSPATISSRWPKAGSYTFPATRRLAPCKPPETQAYYFASLFATAGLLAALYRRERTGQGDHVDASMQETLATQEHIIRLWANEKQIPKRAGSQHGSVAPAKIFPCRDGFVYLYVTRQHWKLFLSIWKDHPAVFDAPDWLNNVYRRAHADELNPAVEAFLGKFTMAEITELLQAKGIPCVPVNTPMGFANDEHVRGRGFMAPVEHAGFGSTRQPAMPFVIDGARPAVGSVPLLDSWRDSSVKRVAPTQNDLRRRTAATVRSTACASSASITCSPGLTARRSSPSWAPTCSRVESSKGGMDPFRFFGTGEDPNLSPRFLEFNRNKRSFTVNLKHPKGQGVLHDLVAKADAVLDNYSVDVVERIGLAYDQLCRVKPDIVNLRMPGLGTTGPKRHFSTVGVNITSFTGLTYMWNHPGVPIRRSVRRRCFRTTFPGRCARLLLFPACFIATGRRRARSSTWRNPKRRRS